MAKEPVKQRLSFLADGEKLVNRKMYDVPLSCLSADPNQPRKHFDEVAMGEMVASINRHGVLQPVIFRRDEPGGLILVSGERRFRASQQAGQESIPGVFIDDGDAVEIALVENLLRENLNPIEEAEALQRLKEEQSYTQEQLSEIIGKAVSTISEILSLNKLPAAIKEECRKTSTYSRRMLIEIAKKKTEEAMTTLFESVKSQGEKSRDTVRSQNCVEVSPAVALKGKVGKFRKMLDKADFDKFGDERGGVENELRVLSALIQAKLPVAA